MERIDTSNKVREVHQGCTERIGTYNKVREVREGCTERIGTYNKGREVREGCTERMGTYSKVREDCTAQALQLLKQGQLYFGEGSGGVTHFAGWRSGGLINLAFFTSL